ncbi:hypothetical protein F5Y14DRAFT_243859 [Nemania sp. NC0429]|nr:hypothetical protein F5Y14DRAFT_243859 [Nemania sp. NC0429]
MSWDNNPCVVLFSFLPCSYSRYIIWCTTSGLGLLWFRLDTLQVKRGGKRKKKKSRYLSWSQHGAYNGGAARKKKSPESGRSRILAYLYLSMVMSILIVCRCTT